MRKLGRGAIFALIAIMLSALCWLTQVTVAQSGTAPAVCQVGIYLISLHDFDPGENSFGADLWLWSVCPNQELQPLETMEFINADAVTVLLDHTELRDGRTWSNRKITGTFRHDWDDRDFPFDRQRLRIELEEGADDVQRFVYEPDTANTTYDPDLEIPGWTIARFTLHGGTTTYNTTFGDPALAPDGSSDYSLLSLEIDLKRTDLSGFFKLTAVVYAAFILSLLTYAMHQETRTDLGTGVGILGGALFAIAVNMVTASAALGSASGINLVDKIHIVVLVYILVATLAAVLTRELVERGWSAAATARLNIRIGIIAAMSFVAINALLIILAMRGG